MLGHDGVGDHSEQTADEPVKGQTGGNGETDPQGHQGHHHHHHFALLGSLRILGHLLVLHTLFVGDDGVVGLLADPHLQKLAAGGNHGNQESTDVCPVKGTPCPDFPVGNGAQIDAQKIKVDALQRLGADAGDGGGDVGCIGGDGACRDHLIVVGIAGEQIRRLCLDHLDDLGGDLRALTQNVDDGLTDDGKQGEQNQHGNQTPQAAAEAHGSAFLPLQLLDGFVLLLLIVGILALDLLNAGLHTGHLHHALLGLGVDGQQNELDDDGEKNHGDTVIAGGLIQEAQQPAEGDGDDIGQVEREKH